MKKILLSSVIQPFGEKYGDGFGVSYEGTHQIMWAQGIFRTRGTTTQWGIDFIAENLETPTVTLHYPTLKRFISEIKKNYDYVGIAFISATFPKILPMVKAIRRYAPNSKIILGGYGTILGDKLKPYADYICRGEGVEFMRKLLGENIEKKIKQPNITQYTKLFSLRLGGKNGYIIAGLGCPNGCDFCQTSNYYNHKHIKFLPDGNSILQSIKDLRNKHTDMVDFWINDEDFLLNKERGMGFLDAIRKSKLPPLAISVFSSMKALAQYKATDLVEMGIDWIWIGFEGKESKYSKSGIDSFKNVVTNLQNNGISVLASMIIGFDYQTPEIIQEEFDELMSICPSMCQFLIYGPAHETKLFHRLNKAGRLNPDYLDDHSQHDGFSLVFKHPHITPDEMVKIQRNLYHKEFKQLGPSVYRVAENLLHGYVNLRNHPIERVKAKAERYGTYAHDVQMIIPAGMRYLNGHVNIWLDKLQKRLAKETGPLKISEKIKKLFVPHFLRYTDYKIKHNIGQQPEFSKKTFRK